ncbi:hypothetical protein [Hyphococcus sp.]|uniref:hypothetical protein n=1 Tax=Hyphococcus sp. TaxID=2038636 RepID=UPI0035C6F8F4
MWWFLKRFWVALVTVATLIGIYYMPADIEGVNEAGEPYRRLADVFSQEQALWTFAVLTTLYIIWMDVRPWLYERFHFGPRSKWMIRAEEAEAKLQELTETRLERIARMPDISEGRDKNSARDGIRRAAKDYLWPAREALTPYYAAARDVISRKLDAELARREIVKGSDALLNGIVSTDGWSIHDLEVHDRIKKLTLHQAETHYYNCFCRLMESVELTYALVNSAPPIHSGAIDRLKEAHDKWKPTLDAAIAAHIQMGLDYPELRTIPGMHAHFTGRVTEPDWDGLKQVTP